MRGFDWGLQLHTTRGATALGALLFFVLGVGAGLVAGASTPAEAVLGCAAIGASLWAGLK